MSPAAVAKALAAHFPLLFGAPRALPLKLRIQADIQARAPGVFTKKALSIFLHRHTTSTAYLKALVGTPTRHDLDGQPAGEVAEEHRVAATAEVERRRGIVEAKRLAEREAQRQAYREAARAARAAGGGAPTGEGATAPADGSPDAARPPRPPRPPRPDGAPRGPRPPQEARGPRPAQGERGPRGNPGDRPPRPPRPDRPDRPDRPQRPPRAALPEGATPAAADAALQGPREVREPREPREPRQPSLPPAELEARRERALLLRAFEGSTLTKANFCVLKRISEAELDSRLAQARQEREARGPDPRQEARPEPRPDSRPEPRRDDRGPRDFGGGRDGRDNRGPRRDAPRAPLPAGERTRPAGSGPAPAAGGGKPPQKPGR